MARKKSKSRKSEKYTTKHNLQRRLERAKRKGKSENYIKDLETAIEKR